MQFLECEHQSMKFCIMLVCGKARHFHFGVLEQVLKKVQEVSEAFSAMCF